MPTDDEKIVKSQANSLEKRLEAYWRLCREMREQERYTLYINYLLGDELKKAEQTPLPDGEPRFQRFNVHTLAMTVGESFEPLFQTICVLQPMRLALILNNAYSENGHKHGEDLKRLIITQLMLAPGLEKYKPGRLTEGTISVHVSTQQDSPTEIFRILNQTLRQDDNHPPVGYVNAVDITGAKKSLIVGSFLYAAHSNLTITYVDFDRYSSRYGKPYGHTCRIGTIDNPYEAFQLRDWERVRQEYQKHNFRSARRLLTGDERVLPRTPGILAAMSTRLEKNNTDNSQPSSPRQRHEQASRSLYNVEAIEAVKRLCDVLDAYEAWENGQYVEAKQILTLLQVSSNALPKAVEVLGDSWPHISDKEETQIRTTGNKASLLLSQHRSLKRGIDSRDSEESDEQKRTDPAASLFNKQEWVLVYAHDECAKIRRLIDNNEDYRSAYLRAVGLDEFLLKARMAICWIHKEGALISIQDRHMTSALPLSTQNLLWRDKFAKLVKESQAQDFIRFLQQSGPFYFGDSAKTQATLIVTPPMLAPYWQGFALDFDQAVDENRNPIFRQLRHEAIHTNLFIPKEIAEVAQAIVLASLCEFRRNWLHLYSVESELATDFREDMFSAPNWSYLLKICDIQFLPPNLTYDGSR